MTSPHFNTERVASLDPQGPRFQIIPRGQIGVSNFPGTQNNEARAFESAFEYFLAQGFVPRFTIQSRKPNAKENAYEEFFVFEKLPQKPAK